MGLRKVRRCRRCSSVLPCFEMAFISFVVLLFYMYSSKLQLAEIHVLLEFAILP